MTKRSRVRNYLLGQRCVMTPDEVNPDPPEQR
jgi:hypothetical protein